METPSDVPAWMMCEDIITRLKEELILEAIDILHTELETGRVDITGYVPLLQDKPEQIQKDMYIIKNLRMREAQILDQYIPMLESKEEKDPQKIQRMEDLKKFVISVRAISALMRFSDIAGDWAQDTGRCAGFADPEEIMIKTLNMDEARCEVLEMALLSSKFKKSEALSAQEMKMLKDALHKSTH